MSPLFPNLGDSKFLVQIVKIKICLQATLYHVKLFHKTRPDKRLLYERVTFLLMFLLSNPRCVNIFPVIFTFTATYRSVKQALVSRSKYLTETH